MQNKLVLPAIAVSTASDITRELPSPSGVAVARSSDVVELANQERLVLTEPVRQVGGVQVMDWFKVGLMLQLDTSIRGLVAAVGATGTVTLSSLEILPFLLLPVTTQVYLVSMRFLVGKVTVGLVDFQIE
jgi:hypothetical protein